ncbi:hypothetical protein AQUCO_03200012v1 [Aquilegia coerulea]|uniref:Uncharacterized protein n=1 Tax=Aquilegia coerulea TaxID=218851 RepID=A0A2G5CZR7_AQUCA|nr:hypothetical protein AQUCO_03200012v1 [Aquilegia coerulea]
MRIEVITVADASSSFRSNEYQPSILPSNLPLLSALFALSLAQFFKLSLLGTFKEKKWDSKRIFGSGGMLSSHSATVSALAVAIGFQHNMALKLLHFLLLLFWHSLFLGSRHILHGNKCLFTIFYLKVNVMYDASGVRLHTGRQAELLNQIVCELPPEHPLSNVRPLRELLGHTPLQILLQVVAGAILGCVISYLMRNSSSRCVHECPFLVCKCSPCPLFGAISCSAKTYEE